MVTLAASSSHLRSTIPTKILLFFFYFKFLNFKFKQAMWGVVGVDLEVTGGGIGGRVITFSVLAEQSLPFL